MKHEYEYKLYDLENQYEKLVDASQKIKTKYIEIKEKHDDIISKQTTLRNQKRKYQNELDEIKKTKRPVVSHRALVLRGCFEEGFLPVPKSGAAPLVSRYTYSIAGLSRKCVTELLHIWGKLEEKAANFEIFSNKCLTNGKRCGILNYEQMFDRRFFL